MTVNPVSALLDQGLGPPLISPASALVLAIAPIAHTPTSHERLAQQSLQIRYRGLSLYA